MNGNGVFSVPGCSRASVPGSSGTRPDTLNTRRFDNSNESTNLWSPCSNCSSSDDNNSPTAVNSADWDKPDLEDKTVDFGWNDARGKSNRRASHHRSRATPKQNGYVYVRTESSERPSPKKGRPSKGSSCGVAEDTLRSLEDRLHPAEDDIQDEESYDSTRSEEDILKEKEELRNVAWFQAGIPREIALEVLSEKPEGSFIVRESTTKLGCYALSLRVPQSKNPTGIAHYLVLHTDKGYKIKGFTKDFPSLKALITHHSIMPELLPCPLSLSTHSTRDAEQEFEEPEQKTCDIFADIHWLMTDLEV